jgi:diguanylate cyclase (GGDEF)-like protein
LKDLVEHSPLITAKGAVPFTTSIGIAMYEGEGAADYLSLVKLADQRLYQAKIQGRNRVETGSPSI